MRTTVTCRVLWFYSSEMDGWVIFGVDLGLSVVCEVFYLLLLPFLLLHFRNLFYHIAQSNRERCVSSNAQLGSSSQLKDKCEYSCLRTRCHLCTCNSENENTVIYVVLSAS